MDLNGYFSRCTAENGRFFRHWNMGYCIVRKNDYICN